MTDLNAIAQRVDEAARTGTAIEQLSTSGSALSLEQAYQVQATSIDRRLDRGEQLVGVKMGFTSRAKMIQMGVEDMIWGRLTDAMTLDNGATLSLAGYVHPRIEPEVAFRLKSPLSGTISIEEAKAAIDGVAVAMEIIDSRYQNFKFSLEDVVADNSSSSSYVIGPWREPLDDISDLAMTLAFDGETVQAGSSQDILGNPYESLVEAARLAADAGMTLEAGWVVLAGAATAAEALRPGISVNTSAEQLGSVSLNIADK
ncbi:MAG: fumarylacetoacetate hydrolase family protein [Gammaproteobacteria bacterium]|jgi:2-oxo-3-hexenedioate decarboxylase|nr:fumarylacetoacetate hydrolase family protein [Gammaproteobacteria bacterium]